MHSRLKHNTCFSAGETIYHPLITSDKRCYTLSQSKETGHGGGGGGNNVWLWAVEGVRYLLLTSCSSIWITFFWLLMLEFLHICVWKHWARMSSFISTKAAKNKKMKCPNYYNQFTSATAKQQNFLWPHEKTMDRHHGWATTVSGCGVFWHV